MQVEQASKHDKENVLNFCKKTFSWGDYIAEIWDYWISEGNLLVIHEKDQPVAICHASHYDDNMWVEGIRVHPQYRRQGIAKNLINHCEKISNKKNCVTIQMLIETNNSNSIMLITSLGYQIKETWDFYTLDNTLESKNYEIDFTVDENRKKFLLSSKFSFVDSWRWYKLTKNSLNELAKNKRIIFSQYNNIINGVAIFSESKHFDKTVIVTILTGNDIGVKKILSDILFLSKNKKYKRIQILSNQNSLPHIKELEKKLSFHLVEKNL